MACHAGGADGAPRRPAPVPFPPGFGHDTGMGELHFPRDEYYMRLALREAQRAAEHGDVPVGAVVVLDGEVIAAGGNERELRQLSLIHISEPTRLGMISYAVFCLKK